MQMVCLPQRGKHCRRNEPPEAGKAGSGLPEHTLNVDAVTAQKAVEAVCVLSSFRGVRLLATPWTVCSQPGSFVYGIFWARILEWVAISFSRDLPNTGMETVSLHWQAGSLPLASLGSPISLIMDVKIKMFLLFSSFDASLKVEV